MVVPEEFVSALKLGLQFNPLASAIACPIVAALAVRSPKKHSLLGLPGVLLLAAWLVGDGIGIAGFARSQSDTAVIPAIAAWAILGLGVGYVLPVWAGAFVGRRVTHGTGWLSAIAIAGTFAVALAAAANAVVG